MNAKHRHAWTHDRSYPQHDGSMDRLYTCRTCHREQYRRNAGHRWKPEQKTS